MDDQKESDGVIRIGLVGLGKMGLSHLSIVGAHPDLEVAAICDSNTYLLDVLTKYCGYTPYTDFSKMLDEADLDAVVIATPSRLHAPMARASLEKGLHVFCEKPFCLDPADSRALSELAIEKGLIGQVGYHNRFVGAFNEVKRLLDIGAIGEVTHVLAEAYGPVVLKPKGGTWRSKPSEGGGCLYDYAAHPLDLVTWYLGTPSTVSGSVLGRIFSREIDDEVYSTMTWADGKTCQLSVNWSDESQRKMTTKVSLWGTQGRIYADRQEVQVYLRDNVTPPDGYEQGWNVRYTTELTESVSFYLRGEEYSAQIDGFVSRIKAGAVRAKNDFETAADTDQCLAAIVTDSAQTGNLTKVASISAPAPQVAPARSASSVGSAARELVRVSAVAGQRYVQSAREWYAARKG